VKISLADPEIILSERFILEKATRGLFGTIKLRSYWNKVHQIFPQFSQVIPGELLKIRMAILHSISECQGYE